jgi:hypothetical protein
MIRGERSVWYCTTGTPSINGLWLRMAWMAHVLNRLMDCRESTREKMGSAIARLDRDHSRLLVPTSLVGLNTKSIS